jgi:hypothetical protein
MAPRAACKAWAPTRARPRCPQQEQRARPVARLTDDSRNHSGASLFRPNMTKTTQIGPDKKIREKNSGAHSGGATECVSRLKGTPISCNLEGASLIRTNP